LFWFTLASACGQAFIFFVIIEFGALANTQVTTLRKLFSVVFTEVFRPQPGSSGLKMSQWMCVLLIFVGVYFGETGKTHEPAESAPAVTNAADSAQEAQNAESK
jgi:UDP-galactose transporter B1